MLRRNFSATNSALRQAATRYTPLKKYKKIKEASLNNRTGIRLKNDEIEAKTIEKWKNSLDFCRKLKKETSKYKSPLAKK